MLIASISDCYYYTWKEARTIDHYTYETYKEAVIKLNLVEDDMECNQCMEEASISSMPL